MAYDKAKWHLTEEFPVDLAETQIYIHTGFYLGWIVQNNLHSLDFAEINKEDIRRFLNKGISASMLYENQGGVLSEGELNEAGRLFTDYYYEKFYFDDYRSLFVEGGFFRKSLASDYHVIDSWENYQKMFDKLTKRLIEWNKFSAEKKNQYKKTFDFDKYGINENSRLINEYFLEKYEDQLIERGFKYLKTKEVFVRNQKSYKELFGIRIMYRGGGCGYTIFPYFGISNKKIEKIFRPYVKGIKYAVTGNPTLIYSSHKIEQDDKDWSKTWSCWEDVAKVDSILERTMQFLDAEGLKFYKDCNTFKAISNLLLKYQPNEIGHPYNPIMVYERVVKGLIAAALDKDKDIEALMDQFKTVMNMHSDRWVFKEDLNQMYAQVCTDILDNKIM